MSCRIEVINDIYISQKSWKPYTIDDSNVAEAPGKLPPWKPPNIFKNRNPYSEDCRVRE